MNLFDNRLSSVGPRQREGLEKLCAIDPVGAVSLAHQLRRWDHWGHGDVVVLGRPGSPVAGAWATGSLMPFGLAARPGAGHVGAGRAGARIMADHARHRLTSRGSVMGPAADVEALWGPLVDGGLRALEERWIQPVLVAPRSVGGMVDAVLRRRPALDWVASGLHAATPEEEELVLPASVAMFTSELGYDPMSAGGSYARHVSWMVTVGRTYVVMDDGAGMPPGPGGPRKVAFKTDVGALWAAPSGAVAQLTGVWTRPDLRGRGVATVSLAAVVDAVRHDHLRHDDGVVTLYVNDFNVAALGLYGRLGFKRVGTFATMLL